MGNQCCTESGHNNEELSGFKQNRTQAETINTNGQRNLQSSNKKLEQTEEMKIVAEMHPKSKRALSSLNNLEAKL
jgi:6-phosphogluconate dehydrogenase (decarboxylating)